MNPQPQQKHHRYVLRIAWADAGSKRAPPLNFKYFFAVQLNERKALQVFSTLLMCLLPTTSPLVRHWR